MNEGDSVSVNLDDGKIYGVVVSVFSGHDGEARYVVQSDDGIYHVSQRKRLSRHERGAHKMCSYTVIDKAYGGDSTLQSVVTSCGKGMVSWSGDVTIWTTEPGKFYCVYCGHKVSMRGA